MIISHQAPLPALPPAIAEQPRPGSHRGRTHVSALGEHAPSVQAGEIRQRPRGHTLVAPGVSQALRPQAWAEWWGRCALGAPRTRQWGARGAGRSRAVPCTGGGRGRGVVQVVPLGGGGDLYRLYGTTLLSAYASAVARNVAAAGRRPCAGRAARGCGRAGSLSGGEGASSRRRGPRRARAGACALPWTLVPAFLLRPAAPARTGLAPLCPVTR